MPYPMLEKMKRIREFGPGLITGAADDDPSGIATYTLAGSQFGFQFLWTAWLTWPLACFVQIMCARIVIVSKKSLTRLILEKFPRKFTLALLTGLFVANTLNVGADLAGMADALHLLVGIDSKVGVILLGAACILMMIFLNYKQMTRCLVWLTFCLLAYIFTGLASAVSWPDVVRASLAPRLPTSTEGWATLVAVLGTTISPYLFFWQASQEFEEIHQLGRKKRSVASLIRLRSADVAAGTFLSNLVMFFIILTAGANLFEGHIQVEDTAQAARALEPLLGRFAMVTFTLGIIGVGLLAVPTLLGSAAFALADFFELDSGLDKKWSEARIFYCITVVSTVIGMLLNFFGINPVKALFWSAIINGLLSPFLLIAILVIASDQLLMKNNPSSVLSRFMVVVTTGLMVFAAFGLFVF